MSAGFRPRAMRTTLSLGAESLLVPGGCPRNVTDAHLAALALEHGLPLCSSDADFARRQGQGLRWEDPLRG